MSRRPIFDKPMTAAERQRRRREKKRADARLRAEPDQSDEESLLFMLVQAGDLTPLDPAELELFDTDNLEPFDLKDLTPFDPAELEPFDLYL